MNKKQVAILGGLASVAVCVFISLCCSITMLMPSREQEAAPAQPKAVQINQASPTVVLPPATKEPTPTSTRVVPDTPSTSSNEPPGGYQDAETLVRRVVGSRLQSLHISYSTGDDEDLQSVPANSGKIGYEVSLSITAASSRPRSEMLQMAYDLAHEFYYNFADKQPYYLTLSLRAGENDPLCVFGLGIGNRAAAQYLPPTRPSDLETWYSALVASRYHADLPGQSYDLLAYGNDPTSKPFCRLEGWKK